MPVPRTSLLEMDERAAGPARLVGYGYVEEITGLSIALSPVCKSGSVGTDGSGASTRASSVSQTDAYTEAMQVQTTFFGIPGHSFPYCNPLRALSGNLLGQNEGHRLSPENR
jgi:hypothetical protein